MMLQSYRNPVRAAFAVWVNKGRAQRRHPMLTHPPFTDLLQLLDFLLDLLGLREVTQEVEIVFLVGPVDLRGISNAQSVQELLVRDITPSLGVIALKKQRQCCQRCCGK